MLKFISSVIGMSLAMAAGSAVAAEISAVSGLYQSETDTQANTNEGSKQDISIGGRYAQPIDGHLYGFGEVLLDLKSYSKGDLPSAPSDSTSLQLEGGVRYFFNKLGDNVAPFVDGYAAFRDAKNVTYGGGDSTNASYTVTEDNGLYYGSDVGMRFNLSKDFFMDLSTNLFLSPLFATVKTDSTTVTTANGVSTSTTSHSQTKSTDLYVSTVGAKALENAKISLGMRF